MGLVPLLIGVVLHPDTSRIVREDSTDDFSLKEIQLLAGHSIDGGEQRSSHLCVNDIFIIVHL